MRFIGGSKRQFPEKDDRTPQTGVFQNQLSSHEENCVGRPSTVHRVHQVVLGQAEKEGAACSPWNPAEVKGFTYGRRYECGPYGHRSFSVPGVRPGGRLGSCGDN